MPSLSSRFSPVSALLGLRVRDNKTGQTIFLGGSPGAGKSYLAAQAVRANPTIRHEIAGQLIRSAVSGTKGYRRPTVADSKVADRFQLLLIQEVHRIRSTYDGPLLLDGHFVVPTKEGPHPVPPEVFSALNVDAFVVVETGLDAVLDRLRNREAQTWWNGEHGSVATLMQVERDHADAVAQVLKKPLFRIAGEGPDAVSHIQAVLDERR